MAPAPTQPQVNINGGGWGGLCCLLSLAALGIGIWAVIIAYQNMDKICAMEKYIKHHDCTDKHKKAAMVEAAASVVSTKKHQQAAPHSASSSSQMPPMAY